MKNITINEIDRSFVSFESAIGNGIALWGGKKPLSNPYKEIELNIDEHFEWGRNINLTCEHKNRISIRDNHLIFNAKILSFEDDGILVVSLDDDVVFIEVSGNSVVEGYVSFSTTPNKVTLYPIEL